MRLSPLLGAAAMATGILLLGGLLGAELYPVPMVNVEAMDLDGVPVLSAPVAQVSPHPTLVVRVSEPLHPRDWQLTLDGRAVSMPEASSTDLLRVTLPGPMAMSSRHTLQLVVGAMRVHTVFQVVPPLTADVSMHLSNVQLTPPVSVAATVRFARPVADRAQAQAHLTVNGTPTFSWRDAQTVEVVSSGFHFSDQALLSIAPGIRGADGTWSEKAQQLSLAIPPTVSPQNQPMEVWSAVRVVLVIEAICFTSL